MEHEHRIEKRPLVSEIVGNNNLIGKDRGELKRILQEIDEPEFRVKQLWHWIYWQGAPDIEKMTNLSKSLRQKLQDKYIVSRPAQQVALKSEDGTRKWLLNLSDNNKVETVFIPDKNKKRGSVCVSSQVGCTLSCKFCHTGTQNLVRNLTAGEIISQFMVVRDAFGEWPTPSDGKRQVSNIVMMGMGEPLYNYDNVVKALKILMDGTGISLSKRKITLSTSGVVPKIRELGEVAPVNLAISLHAVRDDLRSEIVPLNRKYPIAELLQACRDYPTLSNARRITFEYVMLAGVNDSNADAKELVRLIKGIPAKINLIPFNPWPGSKYECSSWERIREFSDIIYRAGYSSPVRMPRGRDILAACGQLKSESERKKGQRVIF